MENTLSPAVKTRQLISLALNLAVVVMEILAAVLSAENNGVGMFRFYTEDSNIFALAACAICTAATIKCLVSKGTALPGWVKTVKYMATCCLTVTLVVVMFVLAPMYGDGSFSMLMFSGSMLYHHFLCPVIAIVSFVFFEVTPRLERRHTLYALIPTILYAVVSTLLNILGVMRGPYPFLYVYEQPVYMSVVWFIVIVGGAYVLAWLLRLAGNAVSAEPEQCCNRQ